MDSSSQNQTDKIILGNCLSCQGLVRVPHKAPSNARVRCPHCAEAYALWQILDQSVPELELVDDSEDIEIIPRVDQVLNASAEAVEGREVFVVPPQLSKGAKRSRRKRSGESGSGSDSSSSVERSDRQASRKKKHKPSTWESSASPKRRRASNPTLELIKIVVGGFLALPIAYLMVFWVFKQDPLHIGPSISKIAPFVVPHELRGEAKPKDEKDKSDSAAIDSTDSSLINDSDSLTIPEIDPDKIKIGTDQ